MQAIRFEKIASATATVQHASRYMNLWLYLERRPKFGCELRSVNEWEEMQLGISRHPCWFCFYCSFFFLPTFRWNKRDRQLYLKLNLAESKFEETRSYISFWLRRQTVGPLKRQLPASFHIQSNHNSVAVINGCILSSYYSPYFRLPSLFTLCLFGVFLLPFFGLIRVLFLVCNSFSVTPVIPRWNAPVSIQKAGLVAIHRWQNSFVKN